MALKCRMETLMRRLEAIHQSVSLAIVRMDAKAHILADAPATLPAEMFDPGTRH